MRRTTRMGALVALVTAVLMSTWGVGTSAAQEHEHPTTTTTAPTTTTTAPTTTTTRPGGTTTTTRPGTTTTTMPSTTTTTRPGATTSTSRPTAPGERTSTVRYGPYTIQPGTPNPDGSHGHAHTGNRFAFGVQKPCSDCYITGMKADLVHPDGTIGGFSTGVQLHHMVLANWSWGRTDATCYVGAPFPLGLLFGQRFFASGDERTPFRFPEGYGYRVGAWDIWNLIWDLASISDVAETVSYQVQFTWVPASTPGMTDTEPVWLDIDQCGDSQVNIPVGPSQQSWTWNVNRPGDLVFIGGHLHDSGINIEIRNDTTGQLLCDSRAGYGETPLYLDHHGAGHISSMSQCVGSRGSPVTRLTNGQRVTIRSRYDSPVATNDAMGIVVGFVAR